MANHTPYFPQANSQYTLGYGMRLDKGTAPEFAHPHVSVTLPDGSKGDMTLHVINGTPDEIKARLLESVDAFFEIYAAPDHSEQHVARLKEELFVNRNLFLKRAEAQIDFLADSLRIRQNSQSP